MRAAGFPVTYSLLDAGRLGEEVEREYGLPRVERCVLFRSVANDVYRVVADGEWYFLKVYRAGWRAADEVAYELELLAHLEARGVLVAAAVRRRDGRPFGTLTVPEGARCYALFPAAQGVKPSRPFTAELYHRFGRATADLHRAADGFVSSHRRAPLDLGHFLDRPLARLRPWLETRPDDWRFLVGVAEKVRARIRASAPHLDWGPCHGDLSLDNLHLTDEGRIVFFDFDSGGPGWRASDPYGVYRYAREGAVGLWEPFLAGYREVRAFGEAEVAAVPYFAAAYAIEDFGHLAANWAAWRGEWVMEELEIDARLEALRRWDEQELGGSAG